MKTEVVARRYCVTVTEKQFLGIMRRDFNHDDGLVGILKKGFPVNDIEYDGHFGAHVWYTVNIENDTPELHKEIQQAIRKYAK